VTPDAANSDLGVTANVMRVVEVTNSFFPDPTSRDKLRPAPKAFELTSEDKRQTKPSLTVWDKSKTSIEEVKSIRGIDAQTRCAELTLAVGKILEIAAKYIKERHVRVAYEPLSDPEALKSGANGHAGIFGIDRRSGEDGTTYKQFRVALADACSAICK